MEQTQLHDSETGEMPYFEEQMMDFLKWYLDIITPEIQLREANKHAIASIQWTMTRINDLNKQIDEKRRQLNETK